MVLSLGSGLGLLLGQDLFIGLLQFRLAILIAADLNGFPVEDLDELIPIDALVFQQGLHHPVHGLPVLLQHGLGPVELLLQDAAHFRIHLGGHFLGIVPLMAPILGDEHLRVPAHEHRANGVAHAELDHHAPGQLGETEIIADAEPHGAEFCFEDRRLIPGSERIGFLEALSALYVDIE